MLKLDRVNVYLSDYKGSSSLHVFVKCEVYGFDINCDNKQFFRQTNKNNAAVTGLNFLTRARQFKPVFWSGYIFIFLY